MTTIRVVQSMLLGDNKGVQFNGLTRADIVGFPLNFNVNENHPINSLRIMHGAVVDGIRVVHNVNGGPVTADHGTLPASTDATLQQTQIDLLATENIIAITGAHGPYPSFGPPIPNRVTSSILTLPPEPLRIVGPLGTTPGTPFVFNANAAGGKFVAISGCAVNGNDSIAQATAARRDGGLYGLVLAFTN